MLCSAISNSSPCQSENITLNSILCKSLKYGLIYATEMVSIQRRFEQTKAIQTVERRERDSQREGKMLRMKKRKDRKQQEKSTEKRH